MEGTEISGRGSNIWSKQKYRDEVGIYRVTRNIGKK